ncbi:hypothetical protein ACFQX6_28845 [Streptosporangium lutulentum]
MLSKEGAGKFMEMVSTLTIVKNAGEGLTLKPGLKSASDALTAAGDNAVWFLFRKWYVEMHDEVAAASGQLMSGKLTVDEWMDRAQKKADSIKSDSSVKKFTR